MGCPGNAGWGPPPPPALQPGRAVGLLHVRPLSPCLSPRSPALQARGPGDPEHAGPARESPGLLASAVSGLAPLWVSSARLPSFLPCTCTEHAGVRCLSFPGLLGWGVVRGSRCLISAGTGGEGLENEDALLREGAGHGCQVPAWAAVGSHPPPDGRRARGPAQRGCS